MATIESAATVGIPGAIGSPGSPRQGITVHYVGGTSVAHGTHANCRAQVRGWHNYHRSLGWQGIGYHYCVCPHGIVLTGRGLNRVGSHSPGVNATRVGVLFMVGGSQQPTGDMLRGFRELRTWLSARGVNASSITGHQQHVSTSCPGGPLMNRVRSGDWSGGGSGGNDGLGTSHMLGLKRGDTGQAVRDLQVFLRDAGHPPANSLHNGEWDGDYGAGTSAAVLACRRAQGGSPANGDHVSYWAMNQLRRGWFLKMLEENS